MKNLLLYSTSSFDMAKMNKISRFEDLSNELLLEIFDYLHALDLFEAFSSLNNRISSLLSFIRLHVIVSKLHCRRQIDLLSSYLIDHAHQVISISLEDQLRDFSSVIYYLFTKHTFENLQSCTFHSIHPMAPIDIVMEKFENLNNLMSVRIFQPGDLPLLNANKRYLSKTFLTRRSSKLRTVELSFRYHYPKLMNDINLNWSITSLSLIFHGSTTNCSIESVLPILRHYRVLRVLRISISNDNNVNNQDTM